MKRQIFYFFFTLCFINYNAQTKDLRYQPKLYVEINHPEWSKNATIYEANIRQYTPEGTFKAFEKHLPRLKKMGVDIIWLMPIHPIGELNRKGKLGSYYSVKDFKAVNPDFGTMEDLKNLVNKIHSMGMYIIIDWVGNHSAWDNPLAIEHPDWYTKTKEGKFQPTPWYDWDDVIDFDYDNPDFRKYMTDALKFWVKETNIDGYRCDVAGFIPVDFWENARTELDQIKPVFMLAEWESRDLYRKSFDMTYSWSLWDKMKLATIEGKGASALFEYMAHDVNSFPYNSYRMTFTDNHDKNSWEGNQYSNFGKGLEAAMVFCSTVNGMPLIYSGQEAGLDRSLAFFEKDLIDWKEHKNSKIYETLFNLKHKNQALWNGKWGGEMIRVHNDNMNNVLSFYREKNTDAVLPIINFSDKESSVNLDTKYFKGKYTELFSGKEITITQDQTHFDIKPWQYLVLVKSK
ncbi:alpha-amylase family glycosyl hydrolase [Chryseobacterium sp. PBS4-4]|uniref:Alpha-amylase family glycosyl hydrolase n=1 Tax=Chryseobacterium edaphi TaxID=2976532 RepID=A0ABT2W9Z5_9FLAO|nr:alpha-amylase family glycosyl hydrolase [Chryseobacterium edaphi]MCU7619030.1 alpha-amylase family glycosyl hydrolase [Chryseobacterium edaphi]